VHKGDGALMSRAYGYAKKGLWGEAVVMWEQAIEANPSNAHAANNLGVAYEKAGDRTKAEGMYRKAISLDPDESVFIDNLAGFGKGLVRKKVAREKKTSSRTWSTLFSNLASSALQSQSGSSAVYKPPASPQYRPSPQPRPTPRPAPNRTVTSLTCAKCRNRMAAPSYSTKIRCNRCGMSWRAYACPCGNRFTTAMFMNRARCGKCGRVLKHNK